jgi:hypothetical protein
MDVPIKPGPSREFWICLRKKASREEGRDVAADAVISEGRDEEFVYVKWKRR